MARNRKIKIANKRPIKYEVVEGLQHKILLSGPTKWHFKNSSRDMTTFYHEDFAMSPNFNFHITVCYRDVGQSEQAVDHHATHWNSRGPLEKKYHFGWTLNSQTRQIRWATLNLNDTDNLEVFTKTMELFEIFEREKHWLVDRGTLRRMRMPMA